MYEVDFWLEDASQDAAGLFTAVNPLVTGLGQLGLRTRVWSRKGTPDPSEWPNSDVGPVELGWLRKGGIEQAKINHVHGLWGAHSIVAGIDSFLTDRHLVISPHGMLDVWAMEQSKYRKRIAKLLYEAGAFKRSSYVHALTTREADDIRNNFGGNVRVEIVPNGIDFPRFGNLLDLSGSVTILFLARLHKKKGLKELIQAWRSYQSEGKRDNIRLVIAGWGDEEIERDLLKERMDNFSFIGPVFGEAKADLLRSVNFCILPSFSEGLPMSILESWSYGVPVVMTRQCNLDEGFGAGAAIQVDPNSKSILGVLHQIAQMTDYDYQEMKRRARNLVANKFSWARVISKHSELYKSL